MKKSIVEEEQECFICGYKGYLERHHIYGGPNRKLSEKYGLTIHLCYKHHQDSREGVHHNAPLMRKLHETGQRAFEKEHNREEFRRIFGINYLDDTEDDEKEQQEMGFLWI